VTWSHHALLSGRKRSETALITTIALGAVFLFFQFLEYREIVFTISDSVFGSVFYMATGFHGLHVTVGVIFLGIRLLRIRSLQISRAHHFSFEASAWY